MEKLKFIYIGKNSESRLPKNEFYALKLSESDKKELYPKLTEKQLKETTIYYPKTDNFYDDSLFVKGIGWKKIGKTNKVIIPTFSGNVEDWDDYILKYGKMCLFYSLSGYSLDSCDCCAYNLRNEFYSIFQCKGGILGYQKYVENMLAIQDIQRKVLEDKFSLLSEYIRNSYIDKYLFRPFFNMYFVVMPPYLDTPADDDKMLGFYRRYRYYEIEKGHKCYEKKKELEKIIFDQGKCGDYTDEYYGIRTKIINDVEYTIDKEISDGIFPICMSDRMKFLYGEECCEKYQYILNNF